MAKQPILERNQATSDPPKSDIITTRGAGSTQLRRSPRWALPTVTVLGLLLTVQLLTTSVIRMEQLPSVLSMLEALAVELSSTSFWEQIGRTILTWLLGSVIAAAIAVPLGLVIASSSFIYRSTRLVIDVLRPIPPIAVLPLAVLVIGSGMDMVVYLVVFSALWPILFQTISGAHDVDPVSRDTSRAYGLNNAWQYRHVVLPSAFPYIVTGLRLSTTIALVVTIATELVASGGGLGYRITQMTYAENYPAMYALIFITGMLGWLSAVAFRAMEAKVLHWHHSQRQETAE